MATSEEAAREILRFVVREQKVLAKEPIPSQPVWERFSLQPWSTKDLGAGLVYAQERGWITREGELSAAGFAAAP